MLVTNQSIGQWFRSDDNIMPYLLYMTLTQMIWIDDIYCLTQPWLFFLLINYIEMELFQYSDNYLHGSSKNDI